MFASFNFIISSMLPLLLGMRTLATPALNGDIQNIPARSVNTCADPTNTTVIIQAYSPKDTAHLLDVRWSFVNANSKQGTAPLLWTFQGAAFKGWRTQQPFTVPLFRLTAANAADFIFMIGADASTPPIVSGFTPGAIVAWVYDTPVCDSVPLMSAVLASATDHYWTTDADDHAGLLTAGWTDGGVVAFVLPVE